MNHAALINRARGACLLAALLALPAAQAQQSAQAPAAAAAVLPGDDFFNYVNGAWLASTEIPSDRSSWGAFAALADANNQRIVQLIESAGTRADARQVADFYRAVMDQDTIEKKGAQPLKPMLEKIAAIADKATLTRMLGQSLRADVDPLNATDFYTGNLFGLWVSKGLNEPGRNLPYLLQGGLGMPERAYYLAQDARMAGHRAAYRRHIAAMLKAAGFDDVDTRAGRILNLETAIARSHATREDSSDIQKANNTWALRDFQRKAPGMDWTAFFDAARLNGAARFIVWHPGAVSGAAQLVASTELEAWRDYLAFRHISRYAPLLSGAFADEHFAFHEKTLNGTPQQPPRWKRALAATNEALDEAVGRLYAERYFPAEQKAKVQAMVGNIVNAFRTRVDQLDWMAPSTRAHAKEKLKTLYVGVGYPDRWKSYAGLVIKPGDAYGNAVRAEQFAYEQALTKLRRKPDNGEWAMPAHLVNAVNLPLQNALNFPAAILQPPFYDPNGPDAANYGAIGAIIGHEISHSFDDQGAQFDAQGRLRDWWTAPDKAHFKRAADKLVAQFSAYRPFPDLAVNGQLTLSENLADLAGVAASLNAFHALHKTPATPQMDAAFFAGYARAWQTKYREPALRQRILTDGHAPAPYRAAIVRNLDAWYPAFDVKPGQALYLPPEQRVKVW